MTLANAYVTDSDGDIRARHHHVDGEWASSVEARLRAQLALGAARARSTGQRVLVSVGLRVAAADPLSVLDHVTHATASDRALAALAAGGRMYWSSARDQFTLVGLGAAATSSFSGADRFAAVDRAWRTLHDTAVIDDDSGAANPGPMFMGGFSFASDAPRDVRWRGFPAAHFVVPRIQLVALGGECRVVMSMVVDHDGVSDIAPAQLVQLCRTVLMPSGRDSARVAGERDAETTYTALMDPAAWMEIVRRARTAIRGGELQKVVLARAVDAVAPRAIDVVALLRHLSDTQPDCFVFGYWRENRVFAGASPERLARLDGRELRSSSLAGSARRGAPGPEDDALAAALLASAKDRTEHAAVSDAIREALAELCDDVSTAAQPSLLTLAQVHHLYTPARGTLREGYSLLDVVARLHPTPAVGGAPRAAALEFVRAHEQLDRGWYAGPIGWVGRDGGEFAVALRSAVIAGAGATLFAGCGIVADSDPALELAESEVKLDVMKKALRTAATRTERTAPDGDEERVA